MPMRKISLSRKASSSSIRNLDGMQADRPPRSRAGSEGPSTPDEKDKGKRKVSLGAKSKKRLSSLFSSSNLSAAASDSSTRSPQRSPLGASTTSSVASTPPALRARASNTQMASAPTAGGSVLAAPVAPDSISRGVSSLRLGSDAVSAGHDSLPATPTRELAAAAAHAPTPGASEHGRAPSVAPSLYSQWDMVDESSDDDSAAFLSAEEGLSEVEEEDEEDAAAPVNGHGHGGAATNGPATGAAADCARELDPTGPTGTLKVRRYQVSDETKVERQQFMQRANPHSIDQAAVLGADIDVCREALTLFLSSRMREGELLIEAKDPDGTHLYLMSAMGIIQSLKGLMTFDNNDIATALEICRVTSATAASLRRPTDSLVTKLGGLVRSGHALSRVKAMTPLERHAELVYAEQLLLKALLGIVGGGDWMGLIKEALNMRTAHGIYRTLGQYLDEADKHGYDDDIDMDFRSGVLLGTGTSSLQLSLLPAKVLKIAEVFGYVGDRDYALKTLMSAGGWVPGKSEPNYDENNEGLRRPICDLILLVFHLLISVLMPVAGVDVHVARNILAYNMKRYPDGIFFLYFQARLHTTMCEPELANKSLQRALDLPLEYVQLQHMCLWDYGCNYLMLCNWDGARQCYSILKEESNWSRAVYTYVTAACSMELIDDDLEPEVEKIRAQIDALLKRIPKLTKKIAGKSLPIEKFVSRKARKFAGQADWLFLPALELSYVFGSLAHTPRHALLSTTLPRIDKALAKLDASTPEQWGNGTQYWDDYALGHFLRGVALATARYQPPEASDAAKQPRAGEPADATLDEQAEAEFKRVLEHAPQVRLDHYIAYHCHYELGRLYARRGDKERARINFDVVLSGKLPEPNPHHTKAQGKYSLEGALQIKTHAAKESLKEGAR
ncbi:hypothetical protein Q5752_002913 [Cryptotrichosporon argae]